MSTEKYEFLAKFLNQVSSKKDSKHHIVPTSRGGNGNSENVVKINERLHELYHNLFLNRTPEEIIEFLVDYFWGGDEGFVFNFLEEKERSKYASSASK